MGYNSGSEGQNPNGAKKMKIELVRFIRVSTPLHNEDFLPRQIESAKKLKIHLKKRGFRVSLDKMVQLLIDRRKLSPPMTEKEFTEKLKKFA
jgi:hypothetical protein